MFPVMCPCRIRVEAARLVIKSAMLTRLRLLLVHIRRKLRQTAAVGFEGGNTIQRAVVSMCSLGSSTEIERLQYSGQTLSLNLLDYEITELSPSHLSTRAII